MIITRSLFLLSEISPLHVAAAAAKNCSPLTFAAIQYQITQ